MKYYTSINQYQMPVQSITWKHYRFKHDFDV